MQQVHFIQKLVELMAMRLSKMLLFMQLNQEAKILKRLSNELLEKVEDCDVDALANAGEPGDKDLDDLEEAFNELLEKVQDCNVEVLAAWRFW